MRDLTTSRAGLIAAAVGFVVFLPSLANGWSGDDTLMIHSNEVVHGAGSALRAWFETYWRPPFSAAGLYRPLTILTYGIDWSLADGAPWWFHLVNVGLHATATWLVVVVVGAWLRPTAALAAGLVFALHPVHVEAVANVVGRAELLVAIGVLGAVIVARRYRASETGSARAVWLTATIVVVALTLHAKESGVIALPVLALDHALSARKDVRLHGALYLGVAAVTVGWFHIWNGVAGLYAGTASHGGFFELTDGQRLSTMFPAYLDLLRILAIPVNLSSDYSPQVIALRLTWSWEATLGLASTSAFAVLGAATIRRAPAVAFSIFVLLLSYAPVSNLLFPSGVILSERGLYLGIVAPAVIAAVAIDVVTQRGRGRFAVGGLAFVVVAFGFVSVERIPFWKDPLNPILEEQAAHPENYRNRYLLSEYLSYVGDTTLALSEMLLAGELNPRDPSIPMYASKLALADGRPDFAVRLATRAFSLHPTDGRMQETVITSLFEADMPDSAVAFAHRALALNPTSVRTARAVVHAMERGGVPDWQRQLAAAHGHWLEQNPVQATLLLDSASAGLSTPRLEPVDCRFLELMIPMAGWLRQNVEVQLDRARAQSEACRGETGA